VAVSCQPAKLEAAYGAYQRPSGWWWGGSYNDEGLQSESAK
jgi:hypothetical protein